MSELSKTLSYIFYSHLPKWSYKWAVSLWYTRMTGKKIDIDNPVTYNEKMQWQKLYDSTRQKAVLSDKYAVRQFVAEKIGEEYLVPLLGVYKSFDEIDFDTLPNQFVLKANHASGWNIIVKDKARFNKKDAAAKFKKWMGRDFSFSFGFQFHYKYIERRIVCEKYLENIDGLDDYKFLCFNGKVHYIWKDMGRYNGHCRNLYDTSWNLLPVKYGYPNTDYPVAPPENLQKMIEIAEVLSAGFPQLRVDLYEVDGRIYFGELTFTSTSGTKQFEPDDWDRKLGELFEVK